MPRTFRQIIRGAHNIVVRAASGDLTAAETSTPITDLGAFNLATILIKFTKLTLPDGDDVVDFYIQTSYDGGTTWTDVEAIHFATADDGTTPTKAVVIGGPQSSAVARVHTSGTLADDTKLDLPLGDRIRIETKVAGATAPTYAYSATASLRA